MATYNVYQSRWGAYALICLSHTLQHVFTQMHIALIPILRAELGLDTVTIGALASIPLLIQAVFTIPSGLLADRINRQRLISVSLLLSAFGGIMMTFANSAQQLILFVCLFSVASTLIHPPALSVIGDFATAKNRGKILGFFGSAGTLGIALGPLTLSLLLNTVGWRQVYLLWSIPALLMLPLIFRLKIEATDRPEKRQDEKSSTDLHILRNISLILLFVLMGTRSMGGNAINTYITPYFVDQLRIEPATAILIFGLNPLMGVFASSISGIAVDRIKERKWLALSFVLQIISLLAVALSANLSVTISGYLCYAFFGLMEMPAEQSIITKLIPRGGRGLAFSLSFLPSTIAGSFSPIFVAFVVGGWGIWFIFPYALTMLAMTTLILAFLWKRIR
ncbi:MAG: hypothetical protein QG670_566 [Thermoproteota archaeon]|nr:hypothetical protein [Thermoproteota archaeon]